MASGAARKRITGKRAVAPRIICGAVTFSHEVEVSVRGGGSRPWKWATVLKN
jgi:hypothetical protein